MLPIITPPPALPLLIEKDDIARYACDDDTLDEADHVDIPAQSRPWAEFAVAFAYKGLREEGRNDGEDEGVECKGEEDFVEVEREGVEAYGVGVRFDGRDEEGRGGDREGVVHGGGGVGLMMEWWWSVALKLLLSRHVGNEVDISVADLHSDIRISTCFPTSQSRWHS